MITNTWLKVSGRVLLAVMLTLTLIGGLGPTGASVAHAKKDEDKKVNICHATASESNPYEAKQVDDDGDWNGHQSHDGDFLYEGPVDDKGKPNKDSGDEWCEQNAPTDNEDNDEELCDDGEHWSAEHQECVDDEDGGDEEECDDGEHWNSQQEQCVEDEDEEDNDEHEEGGSITVCKIVLDANGNVVTGEDAEFTIPWLNTETSQGDAEAHLGDSEFETPLSFNEQILEESDGQDAECITYKNLDFGNYYYGEEEIDGGEWTSPRYNDQFETIVEDTDDFFAYSGELFDDNSENDDDRNTNADGHIVLSKSRPDRTLVVLNQQAEGNTEEDQCVIVSDTLTQEGDDAAVLVPSINSRWTASVDALAKWIWGEDPMIFNGDGADEVETFTREFSITNAPTGATLIVAADNGYSVTVNGHPVGTDQTDGPEGSHNYQDSDEYSIPAGDLLVGTNVIEFTVTNYGEGGDSFASNPAGLLYKLTVHDAQCGEPENSVDEGEIRVVATKVVCTDESDLPNWGNGGPDITATTAEEWVAEHESCSLVPDWQFEWADENGGDLGNTFIGNAGEPYSVFGPTNNNGVATTDISLDDLDGGDVHLREVLQKGFIPFTFNPESETPNANDVSAEFYCSNDVYNYDNLDFIRNPEGGATYYCVAFNTPKETEPTCNPEINLIANGGFETPDVGAGSYDIVEDVNLDAGSLLQWLVDWTNPLQDGGRLGLEIQDHVAGDPAAGSEQQFAELDGDHPVTISQTIPTVIGQEYTVSFKYSPRAGRNAADNQIEVRAGGSTLDAVLAEDGTANGNTVWNTYTRTFTATNSNTLIEFADTGTDTSYGGYLDDVRVSCTPEEETPPACSDDRDNDKDGYTDYPNDPGCSSPEDNDESNEISETDMCPNIEGTQTQLPEGYVVLDNGDCAEHEDVGGGASRHGGGGEVLGATTESVQCSPLLTDYLKMGWANNPEQVTKLQEFLNQFMNSGLPVTGFFGPATHEAVKAFQMKYGMDVLKPWVGFPASGITGENTPTGYVYQTTRWQINNLWCPGSEAFPTPLI